ncbi:hypothetical protein [Streptomyces sp. NPDC046727]|uniref:hypothetical protein n=1 Tax=Streptomyces sp. NPDC046727 TaxID=3155373 RepID=UPI0033CC7B7A
MADEQDKWLNRETAERLLRGEPLEAVDPSARDQAERLYRTLGALSAATAPATGELPGEEAALAAFRKAREAAEAERTAAAHATAAPRTPAPGPDAGLVRIGPRTRTGIQARRPRWARPVRLALAAAVAAGTLGGVAVAAGSGVLPTPFADDHPRPGASAGTDSGQPLVSPSPTATPGGGTGTGTPDGGAEERRGSGSDEAAGQDDTGRGTVPGTGSPSATPGPGWLGAAAACRALRDGKDLDAGRRRALDHLAGGSARVTKYCKVLLATGDSGTANGGTAGNTGDGGQGGQGKDKGGDGDKDKGKGGDGDKDKGDGQGKGNGGGKGADGPARPGHGHGGRRHGGAAPAPSAFAPEPGRPGSGNQSAPSPSPSYTTL